MKTIRNFGLALAVAGTLALAAGPVLAASLQLCAPQGSNASGSKRIVNPNTNNAYTLSGRGCGIIAAADVGYFQSLGYSQVGEFASVIAAAQITSGSVIIPAGAYIRDIILQETSGSSVLGGMRFGTTAGGTDISTGINITTSAYNVAIDASLSKRIFSATAPQTVFFSPVTNFNSAAVNVTVVYGWF